MRNKKRIVSLTAASLVLGSTMATAHASNDVKYKLREPVSCTEEVIQAEKSAIENGNYQAWKAAVISIQGKGIADFLTEERFNIIVRAYKMQKSGDISAANALLESAKVPEGMFLGGGMNLGKSVADNIAEEKQAALMETYGAKDYDAWKKLMDERGGKILEVINENNFARFADAKILQSEGKNEEAKSIMNELGLPFH
jgi:hypothetical protein